MRSSILLLASFAIQLGDAFQPLISLPKNSFGQKQTTFRVASTIISDLRTSNASVVDQPPSQPIDALQAPIPKSVPSEVSTNASGAVSENKTSHTAVPKESRRVARRQAASVSNPITIVETSQELNDLMQGNNSEQLTVVLFHAHYCKICQRAGVQYKRLAATEYSDPELVRFAKVESMVLPNSADTLRSIGVSKFPFVQIYRRGQCVASFSTGPSHMFLRRIRETLTLCLERAPEEWDQFVTEHAEQIEENQHARKRLSLSP